MIKHLDIRKAADYASGLDMEYSLRDNSKEYAELRGIHLSLGAFRAFEWLRNNGYEVTKTKDVPTQTR